MSQQQKWVNVVTEEETAEEPKEAKGAILADDVCQFIFIFVTIIYFRPTLNPELTVLNS